MTGWHVATCSLLVVLAEVGRGRQNVLADLLQPAYRQLRVAYLHTFSQLLSQQGSWQLMEAACFCIRYARL